MTPLRQGSLFVAAGLAQLALDWLVFVLLSAAGVPAAPANLGGRVAGMLLGFWLNGRYTFAAGGPTRVGWVRFARFLGVWLPLTALSTMLVSCVASSVGLAQAWLAKPMVEAALAVVSFLLLRRWVYR